MSLARKGGRRQQPRKAVGGSTGILIQSYLLESLPEDQNKHSLLLWWPDGLLSLANLRRLSCRRTLAAALQICFTRTLYSHRMTPRIEPDSAVSRTCTAAGVATGAAEGMLSYEQAQS